MRDGHAIERAQGLAGSASCVGGGGLGVSVLGAGGTTTIVRWEERLIPPFLPQLGALVQRPILGAIFQGDLERLRGLVESGELPRRA